MELEQRYEVLDAYPNWAEPLNIFVRQSLLDDTIYIVTEGVFLITFHYYGCYSVNQKQAAW